MHKKALEKGRIEAGNQVCVFVTFGLRPSTFALQATADRSVECRYARTRLNIGSGYAMFSGFPHFRALSETHPSSRLFFHAFSYK
jgi:hypothetical protein